MSDEKTLKAILAAGAIQAVLLTITTNTMSEGAKLVKAAEDARDVDRGAV